MIQVQSMSVLFPVAKYWLCLVAADGLNGECRLCWKEWVSVRATSGPSCAQWTWLLHQAASLELAGALGAFCHSSHCSSAPHQNSHLPLCQDWRTIQCVVSASFAHPTAFTAFCWGHLFTLWVISFCQERIMMRFLSKMSAFNLSSQLPFSKACWLVGCGLYNPSFNWHWKLKWPWFNT